MDSVGRYNDIPAGTFRPWKSGPVGPIVIGDCNVIHEGIRIFVGPDGFKMGDYNVVHNGCFLGGPGLLAIGHNCWIGQRSVLDSTGCLKIGNGVTIGYQCHVWSHMARGEQIEGWRIEFANTEICDNVWLVGDAVTVNPGVCMAEDSAALAHSVVTHDTLPGLVYGGVPAKPLPSVSLRREMAPGEEMRLMRMWAHEFCRDRPYHAYDTGSVLSVMGGDERLLIRYGRLGEMPGWTCFDLGTKRYTKRLTRLEREFVRFLRGKAHFVPWN